MMPEIQNEGGWRLRPLGVLLVVIVGVVVIRDPLRPALLQAEQARVGALVPPPELAAASEPERFSAETLFEIINGDADLYLKAGFVQLDTRRYRLKADPRQWLDLLAYQMDDHRSAFAVYSLRRGPEAVAYRVAHFAHHDAKGLFFVHGPYYVEILAAQKSAPLFAARGELAEAFIAAHPVRAETIRELGRFPSENLVAGSMTLHPSGAFGFEGFRNLFAARYRLGDQETTAFFQPCQSSEAAIRLVADYRAFLEAYGGVAVPLRDVLRNGHLVRMEDTWTLIFPQGPSLGGVLEAATPAQAEGLARQLAARLATSR